MWLCSVLYPDIQWLKKGWNDYIIMSELKELTILKKVIMNDLNKIEEINTYDIQKEDTAEVSN